MRPNVCWAAATKEQRAMACPKCGCKTTYPSGFDDGSHMVIEDDERDRCAA